MTEPIPLHAEDACFILDVEYNRVPIYLSRWQYSSMGETAFGKVVVLVYKENVRQFSSRPVTR